MKSNGPTSSDVLTVKISLDDEIGDAGGAIEEVKGV